MNSHRVSDKDSSGLEERSQQQSMSGIAADTTASAVENFFLVDPERSAS